MSTLLRQVRSGFNFRGRSKCLAKVAKFFEWSANPKRNDAKMGPKNSLHVSAECSTAKIIDITFVSHMIVFIAEFDVKYNKIL